MSNVIKSVVYGLGGFDLSKPNNNIIETIYYTEQELELLETEKTQAAARQALLNKLGITEEEARLLLGGN